MKDLKFACPHCGQHIACDVSYANMCIVCPTCGQPMEVPRLSTAEASQPNLCVVASLPTPKHHFPSRIPTIDLWKENEWEERYRAATTPSQPTPAWLVAAMGTFIAAVLLRATFSPAWTITVAVLSGTVLSCYLLLKRRTINVLTNVSSDVDQVLPSLARILGMLILGIPAIILGVLFIGCGCGAGR